MNKRSRLIYEFGPYRLEPDECRLSRRGQEITLRPRLFDLLTVLVEHRGQMLKRDDLLTTVWDDLEVGENNLTVSINALRRTLGEGPYIETVTGRGYRFTAEVRVLAAEAGLPPDDAGPEPPGGAMPLQSRLYIARLTDEQFYAALRRRDSIVLIKGPRQIGKTSLLARGLQQARGADTAVILTDFQHLTATAFASIDKLLLTLAEMIADHFELPTPPHTTWNDFLSPSTNFDRYLRRHVFTQIQTSLVWGLDEVDQLFKHAYASEFFGLLRSWHNLRALEPSGPWQRLTLALAYATEAHLFITDLNQSPFNVGTRLALEDFTLEQVADLNNRYGSPLRDEDELARFYALIAGHPYLAQRGLYEMIARGMTLATVEAQANWDEGIFGDHLRRLAIAVERDPVLCASLHAFLFGQAGLMAEHFYRLRGAGVLAGDAPAMARPRCDLYARYLRRRWQ
ncbi:MAG: AAA-like domain-containing protein [Acidobacteriota bacterium]